MNTNYRERLNIQKLSDVTGVAKEDLNQRQKKAISNIKYCAESKWEYVNSWYDCEDEWAREYMMNPKELFDDIYKDSHNNIYKEGMVSFGAYAEMFLKDINLCGKDFLNKVCFYYLVRLLEESVVEVDGTEEDVERVYHELDELMATI